MNVKKKIVVIVFSIMLLVIATCTFALIVNENHSGNAKITLSDDKVSIRGEGVYTKKSNIIINRAGIYSFSGKLSEGHIIVDVKSGNVVINFDNVSLLAKKESLIQLKSAHRVTLNVKKNTINSLTLGNNKNVNEKLQSQAQKEKSEIDVFYKKNELAQQGSEKASVTKTSNDKTDEQDKKTSKSNKETVEEIMKCNTDRTVIASEVPFEINGIGDLFINSYNGCSIVSKGDLLFDNANLTIVSTDNAIISNKNIDINGGMYNITSGNSGVLSGGYINSSNARIDVKTGILVKKVFEEVYQGNNQEVLNKYKSSRVNKNYWSGLYSEKGISFEKSDLKFNTYGNSIYAKSDIALTENSLKINTSNDAIISKSDLKTVKNNIVIENAKNALNADVIVLNDKELTINCTNNAMSSQSDEDDIRLENSKINIKTNNTTFVTQKAVIMKNSDVRLESTKESENSIFKNVQTDGGLVVEGGSFIAFLKNVNNQIWNKENETNFSVIELPEEIKTETDYEVVSPSGQKICKGKLPVGTQKIVFASNKIQDKMKLCYLDKVIECSLTVVEGQDKD